MLSFTTIHNHMKCKKSRGFIYFSVFPHLCKPCCRFCCSIQDEQARGDEGCIDPRFEPKRDPHWKTPRKQFPGNATPRGVGIDRCLQNGQRQTTFCILKCGGCALMYITYSSRYCNNCTCKNMIRCHARPT